MTRPKAVVGGESGSGLVPVAPGEVRRRRAIARASRAKAVGRGNSNALKSGVYSSVAVREDVLDMAALVYASAPWLDPIRDALAVEATARLVVRLRRLDVLVDACLQDLTKPTQEITSMYSRLESQLLRNLSELGLTPRAAADLGLAKLDAKARAMRLSETALAAYQNRPPDPKS
jgi:hypothetical protein